jgi:hypothetical protein
MQTQRSADQSLFSYVYGACYLKQTISTLFTSDYAWTAQLISDSSSPEPTKKLSCLNNADDQKTYIAKSGGSYTVECGVDYAGGDLKSIDSTTFQSCMDTCDTTAGCIDVSWVWGKCYMNALNPKVILGHVWTGRMTGRPVSSSTTLSASAPTSTSAAASSSSTLETSSASSTLSTSNTPSATPTAPSTCTFKLGFINKKTNAYIGRSLGSKTAQASLPGWNPTFPTVKAGDTSATTYIFTAKGKFATAADLSAAFAATSMPPTGVYTASVAWFATPDQLAIRQIFYGAAEYVSCVRDRTQTPSRIICSHGSMGTSRIVRCGPWIYFYQESSTVYPNNQCYDVSLVMEDEVCT